MAKTNLWHVFKSVAASVLGVQSDANYKSDFEQTLFCALCHSRGVICAGSDWFTV